MFKGWGGIRQHPRVIVRHFGYGISADLPITRMATFTEAGQAAQPGNGKDMESLVAVQTGLVGERCHLDGYLFLSIVDVKNRRWSSLTQRMS